MKSILSALALLVSAGIASAQDGYDKIKVGDRVMVLLRNKNALLGHVTLPNRLSSAERDTIKKPEEFDLSKETHLTIDLALSNPGLGKGARISMDRSSVKQIKVLQPLSLEERKRLTEAIGREKKRIEEAEAERRTYEATRAARLKEAAKAAERAAKEAEASAKSEKEKAELKKALEFYNRFPPPEWGPHRLDEIVQKGINKLPITLDEREYQKNYDLWTTAHNFIQKSKEKWDEEENKKKEGEGEEPK